MALKIAGNTVVDDNLNAYVDGVDLSAISASIADTAVDVFVYDTRKDSDGGAWRKRTQHTSWYNETLNTATRGSRKEFPAVAVIVAESNQVTIYDGDDPDLPMWMVFNKGGDFYTVYLGRTAGTITSISMLNGILCVGDSWGSTAHGEAFTLIDFNADYAKHYDLSAQYQHTFPISGRNYTAGGTVVNIGGSGIVNIESVNDIAMTVLPNAPIDDATGLPIPTIAVATDGGVSVIKDDGSVVDITLPSTYNYIYSVDFIGTDKIAFSADNSTDTRSYRVHAIPSSDVAITAQLEKQSSLEFYADGAYTPTNTDIQLAPSSTLTIRDVVNNGDNTRIIGGANNTDWGGVYIVNVATDPSESLHSHITSTYNTGWMNGDIKLATLSDTDATNVTGSELVTNGTFDTASDWTASGDTGLSISGGQATITLTSTNGLIYQNLPTLSAGTYTFSINWVGGTQGNLYTNLQDATTGASRYSLVLASGSSHGVKTYTVTIPAQEANLRLAIYGYYWGGTGGGTTLIIDDVTLRLAEEDRSVNGNGLQVFGTVTKTPVATGADLVAYSGFSASNYFKKPYDSSMDWGTGDFCYMNWVKGGLFGGANQRIVSHGSGGNEYITYFADATSGVTRASVKGDSLTGTTPLTNGTWTHIALVRQSNVLKLYINGKFEVSSTSNESFGSFSSPCYVGIDNTGVQPAGNLAIALLRISATAPTAEQIAKIYEDEKVLFQEGSQATLYGSSDAVTALAYDSDTDLLHVGTSAGRSVFSGLRRVDNTTDAVGSAISASNGMVAED